MKNSVNQTPALKPKKKNISALKKKILWERLRKQISNSLTQDNSTLLQNVKEDSLKESFALLDSVISSIKTTYILRIFHLIMDTELEDPDELTEVVDNIKELLMPIGSIKKISIMKSVNDILSFYFVDVLYHDSSIVYSAQRSINGLVIGGIPLYTEVLTMGGGESNVKSNEEVVSTTRKEENGLESNSAHSNNTLQLQYKLKLDHILTSDDLLCDDEELIEILNDVNTLCQSFSQTHTLWVPDISDSQSTSKEDLVDLRKLSFPIETNTSSDLNDFPWIVLECASPIIAMRIISALQGLVVGGNILNTAFYDVDEYYKQSFLFDHLIPVDEDINEKHSSHYTLIIEDILPLSELQTKEQVESILEYFQGLISGFSMSNIWFLSSSSQYISLYIFFLDIQTVLNAYSNLFGLQYNNITLKLAIGRIPEMYYNKCRESLDVNPLYLNNYFGNQEQILPYNFIICKSIDTNQATSVVVISSYVTAEDLEELASEEEELFALKMDLLQLIQDQTTNEDEELIRLSHKNNIHDIPILANIRKLQIQSNSRVSTPEEVKVETNEIGESVWLECKDCEMMDTLRLMVYFEGLIIGGKRITARLFTSKVDDLSNTITNNTKKRIEVSYSPQSNVISTLGQVIIENNPNQQIFELSKESPFEIIHQEEIIPDLEILDSNILKIRQMLYSNQKVSTYSIAQLLPKLSVQTKEIRDRSISSLPCANEEINIIIKEFLKQIATFQIRLKEKEKEKESVKPMDGKLKKNQNNQNNSIKYKLRYVTGMKQVLKNVKLGKVKLILIAPNTEPSEELDSMIESIVSLAQSKDIPVLYCLSKRLLGKALLMSMKQTMVAILDPNGVFHLYKKIVQYYTNQILLQQQQQQA